MKSTLPCSIPALIIISVALSLTYCNSPTETEENITTIDTTTVETDSISIVSRKPLTLIVKNLTSSTAPVVVGVYKSNKNFLHKEGRLKEYKFIPTGKTLTATITDLKYGEYAMAIYQDVNSSGKIDKNMIGMPTEGYAFSNNFKPKVKAPVFDDCKFNYDSTSNTVTTNLIH